MSFSMAMMMKPFIQEICPLATPGSTVISSCVGPSLVGFTQTTYFKLQEIHINYSGTFTITHQARNQQDPFGNRFIYTRIYKNGIAYGTERTKTGTSPSTTTYSEDLSFINGDLIQLYAKSVGGQNHCAGGLTVKASVLCSGGGTITLDSSGSCPY